MTKVVIIAAKRTPIGKFQGGLASLTAPELGAVAIRGVLDSCQVPASEIDEVIMGNVLSGGVGQAPARQAALKAGLPHTLPALTINKVCGSGLKAVMLAASAIRAGDAKAIIAGGMESMSNAPFYAPALRNGQRLGNSALLDGLIHDGLWDSFHNEHMGCFADYTAEKANIDRDAQDNFALESHKKALAARSLIAQEILPVEIKDKKGNITYTLTEDEGPRSDTSLERLAKLRSAFTPTGSVTPGNASTINDGAAALIVASVDWAKTHGITPLAEITAYATSGVAPKEIFFAPGNAVELVMSKLGVSTISYFDLLEINEAFAAQVLANEQQLKWDRSRLNVLGGAISLGHPIGASGARILVTLLTAMSSRDSETGIASLCLGGGNAVALSVKRG